MKRKLADYEQTFEEFWRPLVVRNGRLSLDLVKRELHDFRVLMREAAEVFEHVTNGRISKPNTAASAVISEHDAICEEEHREQWRAELNESLRDLRRALRQLIANAEMEARSRYRGRGRWRPEWKAAEPHQYERIQSARATLRSSRQ
jgi:hypothetical protein